MEKIVLLEKTENKILPLHSVNCAPYNKGYRENQYKVNSMFKLAHIPYSRLHDACGEYGGSYFVDVPNIFRDFDKDETNPCNYDFYYTDEYIRKIIEAGGQIVYRLGISIEHGSKQYTTAPPKDMEKWARICERIIAHYNEGWCDGFHYDITYWEIWNEPENPPMWSGSKEQYFELYRITSKYLKEQYPKLKIGGYGSCGFYAVTNPEASEFQKSFIQYFKDFLILCRDEQCPLDFFSWHIYTSSPEMLMEHARYVRKTLNDYGFHDTESHLNEWNYGAEGGGFLDKHTNVGASFLAASLIDMQKSGVVDMAMYYVASMVCIYNGFLNQNDRETWDIPFWVYVAFGEMFMKGKVQNASCTEGIRALAAYDDEGLGLLVTNYSADVKEVEIVCEQQLRCYDMSQAIVNDGGKSVDTKRMVFEPYTTYYFRTMPK